MTAEYNNIEPGGSDTAGPRNILKRLSLMQRYTIIQGSKTVDCGCGAGDYTRALRLLGARAWGIEYSHDKVAAAAADLRGCLTVGDLHDIALRDGSVDLVLMNEVIEHVPDDRRALKEINRVLRVDGTLVLFAPNRLYPFETHGTILRGSRQRLPHYIPFVPYIPLRLAKTALAFWARNYWPHELRQLVSDAGFRIRHSDYVWQTFEGISQRKMTPIRYLRPMLRAAAGALERVPAVRPFGISQVIVATKVA